MALRTLHGDEADPAENVVGAWKRLIGANVIDMENFTELVEEVDRHMRFGSDFRETAAGWFDSGD